MTLAKAAIRDLNEFGQGVGVVESTGMVVFVDGALPGEVVDVHMEQVYGQHVVGRLHQMLHRSEDRIIPACRYFGECGGCTLHHLSYEGQLKWKWSAVRNALKRIGKMDNKEIERVLSVIPMDNPYRYRCKVTMAVQQIDNEVRIGYYKRNSHNVIQIDDCLLQPEVGQAVQKVCNELIGKWIKDKRGLVTLTNVIVRVGWFTGEVMVGWWQVVQRKVNLPVGMRR